VGDDPELKPPARTQETAHLEESDTETSGAPGSMPDSVPETGTLWGPLMVLEQIGSGGFGDVFRARDRALGRDVALKLIKATRRLSSSPASIIREGQLLARVHHPNVMAVYGAREVDGQIGIWSEFLQGRTLAQIVAADGVLSAQEALVCAETLTLALSAVHRAGLLHRDIKAQNVMRERGGRLVLMDFGVGREVTQVGASAAADPLSSSELAGTPVYLAPELFRGSPASIRSDIYSLGVLLFFLVTGTFPVRGARLKDIATQHGRNKPQRLHDLRPDLPAAFVEIVERAINPDPDKRFESCGEFHETVVRPRVLQDTSSRSTRAARMVAMFVVGAALAGAGFVVWGKLAANKTPLVFSILPPPGGRLTESIRNVAAVSPNSQSVAFVATDAAGLSRSYVRSLGSPVATPVVDSEGASNPFWAPDGSALAFFSRSGLKVVTLSGVRSGPLTTVTEDRGGTWIGSNELLIAPGPRDGLYRLPATGGSLQLLIGPDRARGELGYMWPQFLSDGRRFIYFVLSNDERVRGIYLASLDGKPGRRLIAADASGVIGGDHLLFVRDGALVAQRFDSRVGELTGSVEQVISDVATSNDFHSAISATADIVVYSSAGTSGVTELTWYDGSGQPQSKIGQPARYRNPALSQDARYLAVERFHDSIGEIQIFDLFTGGAPMRIAPAVTIANPVWGPGGRLAYAASMTGWMDIYTTTLDNPNAPEAVVTSTSDKMPTDWSPDGKYLAYVDLAPGKTYDVWVKPLEPPGAPMAVATTDAQEAAGTFSRDGSLFAYLSTKNGRPEIYVRSFPTGSDRKASANGGFQPSWGEGRELYYLDPGGRLMTVTVPPQGPINPGRLVLQTRVITPGTARNHYVLHSTSGGTVLVNSPVYDAWSTVSLTGVLNWAALKRQK
jgi:eukaryotic-like serine/threonine-protein kinase